MITFAILQFLFSCVPYMELPAQIEAALSQAADWTAVANYYIPVDTFLVCIGVYFTVWLTSAALSAVLALL